MSYKQGQETTTNYIDGLKVKISEKYKPPPRINLVMSYSQRLSLNKKIQDNMPNYDFTLEHKINDKINEYKNVRKLTLETRNERLDKIKEARRKFEEQQQKESKEANVAVQTTRTDSTHVQYEKNSNVLIPTQVPSSTCSINILTPTVSNKNEYVNSKINDRSPFNISEFEADTSSPFDNMELKTINDMEELALVLKGEGKSHSQQYSTNYNSTTYNNYSQSNNSITSYSCNIHPNSAYAYNRTNGYYCDPYSSNFNYKLDYNYDTIDPNVENQLKSVPDIMKDLQTELDNSHISQEDSYNILLSSSKISHQIDKNKTNRCENSKEDLENPYNGLTKELQNLSLNISLMGFPLDRVARACAVLGNDNKKVSIIWLFFVFNYYSVSFIVSVNHSSIGD